MSLNDHPSIPYSEAVQCPQQQPSMAWLGTLEARNFLDFSRLRKKWRRIPLPKMPLNEAVQCPQQQPSMAWLGTLSQFNDQGNNQALLSLNMDDTKEKGMFKLTLPSTIHSSDNLLFFLYDEDRPGPDWHSLQMPRDID
ncbi:hypothetical protein V6N12_034902 [Hibiscus sabdariffa]|uniref:Uncharacterized protein n=1 Tax=Hibiscus sabdariffa TaxID=183260 RepID=A0ABR2BNT4_9ROSI